MEFYSVNNDFEDETTERMTRVVMIGDTKVGKSSLLLKYFRNTFSNDIQPTIGASIFTQTIQQNGKKIVINYYDTAGQETYRSLGKLYYRDAIAAILVFDLTDLKSFQELESWINEFKAYSSDGFIFIAGNKYDMKDEFCITEDEAVEKANKLGCDCLMTSAFDGVGVNELFQAVSSRIVHILQEDKIAEDFTKPQPPEPASNQSCC